MTTTPTPTADDSPTDVAAIREMTPTAYARQAGRPVPEWFNLDLLVTSAEVAEIEDVRQQLRDFVRGVIPFAEKVRRVVQLADRPDTAGVDTDGGFDMIRAALALDEIDELRHVVGYLLDPDSTINPDHLPKLLDRYGDAVPGLADAITEMSR